MNEDQKVWKTSYVICECSLIAITNSQKSMRTVKNSECTSIRPTVVYDAPELSGASEILYVNNLT